MTIDPTVDAAFAHLAAAMTHDQRREAEASLVLAVRTAHLQELVGETLDHAKAERVVSESPELAERLRTMTDFIDKYPYWVEMTPEERPARMHGIAVEFLRNVLVDASPLLTAPLRAKLQAQEARIDTLEQERNVFRHTLNALHGAITNGVFLAADGEDAPLAQREFDNLCVVLGYKEAT